MIAYDEPPDRAMLLVLRTLGLLLCMFAVVSPAFAQHTSDARADSLGFLLLRLPVDSAFVVVDGDFARPLLVTPTDSVLALPAGGRRLVISSRTDRDVRADLLVPPDSMRVVSFSFRPQVLGHRDRLAQSSYPRIVWGANLAVHTDPDAEIRIGEDVVGTGIAHLDLAPGEHRVTTVGPDGHRRSGRITVTDDRLTVSELYVLPDKTTYYALALVPGGGRFYRRQPIRGGIAAAAVAGLTLFALRSEVTVRDLTADFDYVSLQYRGAWSELDAWELGNRADAIYEDIGLAKRRRNVFIGAAIGVYVVQALDAIRTPQTGFRQRRGVAYLFDPVVDGSGTGVRLRIGVE